MILVKNLNLLEIPIDSVVIVWRKFATVTAKILSNWTNNAIIS